MFLILDNCGKISPVFAEGYNFCLKEYADDIICAVLSSGFLEKMPINVNGLQNHLDYILKKIDSEMPSKQQRSQPRSKPNQNLLYCSEEDGKKDATPHNGSNHQVLCTTAGCKIWTGIWLPEKINLGVLKRQNTCGFCTAEIIKSLVAKNSRLQQTIWLHTPEKLQQSFAEIVQKTGWTQKGWRKSDEENHP